MVDVELDLWTVLVDIGGEGVFLVAFEGGLHEGGSGWECVYR